MVTTKNRDAAMDADEPRANILKPGPPLVWWKMQLGTFIDKIKDRSAYFEKVSFNDYATTALIEEMRQRITENDIHVINLKDILMWAEEYKDDGI